MLPRALWRWIVSLGSTAARFALRGEHRSGQEAALPAERLLLETDAPCCDVRKSHAGWPLLVASGAPKPAAQGGQEEGEEEVGAEAALVKGRNEPCELDVVLHVLAAARGEEPAALSRRRSLLIRGAALGSEAWWNWVGSFWGRIDVRAHREPRAREDDA